ncbi:Bifunctional enzyme that catalyzes the epimerization of the S- and R-forms of NAD(P)HX and the dehydration of the S-form of NAD(P)HX at the expense of ADP [Vibrio sp. B1FLJ16]|nr:Bifunctional enzyme that catalyzes the epimerization of the S- and R-forms of NAD(P)HX and the dehydration of the S-form of NAD(P)HX at the expense of ADP [Vibrio sp. B1FLJ16]CAE6935916.1 Bifunctional enzyme that catalyzes the epimerization of the S- and R-forms of NAD(P)HX and the dehydration of the S-form of NAD(P)HX at the expense of ADP [Vibrio sp. B1FLJ16]
MVMDFNLALKLYTAEQVKNGEVSAAQIAGVSMFGLMQRAGMAVYERFLHLYPRAKNVLVVCGKGNNGGDGYIFATLAKQAQLKVSVFQFGDTSSLTGDALCAYEGWQAVGGQNSSWDNWNTALLEAEVIIDAMLGTGLSGEVRSEYRRCIEQINQIHCPVIAVDIPSGLSANTGAVLGAAICANHTVTFIGVKQGLCTARARDHVGELHYFGLGVNVEFDSVEEESALGIDHQVIRRLLPPQQPTAHKGDNGKLLCVGGNLGMSGAIRFSSSAAARTGSGLTAGITHPDSLIALQVACPEVMSQSITADELRDTENELTRRIRWADALVFGPGFGDDEWAYQAYQYLSQQDKPKVVDADGLNILAMLSQRSSETFVCDNKRVITPHPGEAARLLNVTTQEVERDRYSAARQLQERFGGVVVLKGAGTLIYDGARMYVCLAGNPGMASGGMGDVLSGVIGALLAKGIPIAIAARLGVMIHSHAADLNATQNGERGLLASDVVSTLRCVLNP